MSDDSFTYLSWAHGFAEAIRSGAVSGWDWIGPEPSLLPLFPSILAGFAAVFGAYADIAFVCAQAVVDAATCVVIARLAGRLRPDLFWPAGLLAAINPTMIALSGLVLTDTLFLLFITLALSAAQRWIAAPGDWRVAIALGVWLGLALLTRGMLLPAIGALAIYLLLIALVRRASFLQATAQIALIVLLALAFLAPVVARNLVKHDTFAITSQTGAHALLWLVPLVQEAKDGTPFKVTVDKLTAEVIDPLPREVRDHPFRLSRAMTDAARDRLAAFGTGPILKAWVYGMGINIVSPASTMVQPLARLPRLGFYDTPGDGFAEKLWNFLFSGGNALYASTLLFGMLGVAIFRIIQLIGLGSGLLRPPAAGGIDRWALALLLLWGAFVLVIAGPIASPKYRLPLEPMFCILFALGWTAICRRMSVASRKAAAKR